MNDIFPGIDFGQKTVQKFGKNKEITILLTFLKNNDTSMLKFRNSEKATKIWSIFHLNFDATNKVMSKKKDFDGPNF